MDRVRDNTSRLGLGIGRLSKGEMKAFQAAFVAADADLDGKVCKNGTSGGEAKKCEATSNGGLEEVYKEDKIDVEAGPNIATSEHKKSRHKGLSKSKVARNSSP